MARFAICIVIRYSIKGPGCHAIENGTERDQRNLTSCEYRSLAELRHQSRLFLHFTEQAARSVGLNPRQHQPLLAFKGLPSHIHPSVGELARRLHVQPHTTVELANHVVLSGYLRRRRGGRDRREALPSLTRKGQRLLRELSLYLLTELCNAGPNVIHVLQRVEGRTAKSNPSDKKLRE
ncbi:MAG: MarR family transcriptional regulator [Candidatus Acidiferrales bacterium]